MKEFELEEYRAELPRLMRARRFWRTYALTSVGMSVPQMVIGIVAEGGWVNWCAAGVLLVSALASSAAMRTRDDQIKLIQHGGRPTGVYMTLLKRHEKELGRKVDALEERVQGFGDQVAAIQVEAEKLAEDEASQWWRQPGSVWHETQQFIDATDQVFRAREQEDFDRMLAEQAAKLEAARIEQKRLDQERRIAATERWIEEQRKWDAFKEDAQMEARTRKERGDWYEPPLGVPGGVNPDEEAAVKEIAREFREAAERMNQQLAATLSTPFETHQVRSWGNPDPVDIFVESPDLPKCSKGKSIYNRHQAEAVMSTLRGMRMDRHYRVVGCAMHYHLTRKVR